MTKRIVTFEELPELMEILIMKVEDLAEVITNKVIDKPQKSNDQWLSIDELRDYIPDRPSKATIYGWVHQRKIPHHKGSKKLRFLQSEINQWMAEGKRKTESELLTDAQNYLAKKKGGKRYE